MKKNFFVCIVVTLGLLTFFMTTDVLANSHVQEFYDRNESLFKRTDIQSLLPDALLIFNKLITESSWNQALLISGINSPRYLWSVGMNRGGFDENFIKLVVVDDDLRKLMKSDAMFNILKNKNDMNKLINLIESAPLPETIDIVSGDNQTGKPNTTLSEPLVVIVKDEKGVRLAGIRVTFEVIFGSGRLSRTQQTTNSQGKAQTTMSLGSSSGPTLIQASVDGISDKLIFLATTIAEPPTPGTDTTIPDDEVNISISPSTIVSPEIGKKFTLNVNIENAKYINGYVIIVKFNSTVLAYDTSTEFNGDFINVTNPTFDPSDPGKVKLIGLAPFSESSGDGILAKLTFEVKKAIESEIEITLDQVYLSDSFSSILSPVVVDDYVTIMSNYNMDINCDGSVESDDLQIVVDNFGETVVGKSGCEINRVNADVDRNGIINILDLILVAQAIDFSKQEIIEKDANPDVNGDGKVDIMDLVLVGASFGETVSAPSLHSLEQLNVSDADIQGWITQAKAFQTNSLDTSNADPAYQRGIAILEELLATLIQAQKEEAPQKTALLTNYPNPFNPETWIPYQLAEATDVTIVIHAMNGSLVRRLSLGHQVAGMYRNKNRAAYWDGRNAFGEPVASGLYFYTLTAGNYSATHKMLIRK